MYETAIKQNIPAGKDVVGEKEMDYAKKKVFNGKTATTPEEIVKNIC